MLRLASHVVQSSSTFLDLSLFTASSSVLPSMVSFDLQHCKETSDGYLLTAMVSIVLPSVVSFDLQHCTGNE